MSETATLAALNAKIASCENTLLHIDGSIIAYLEEGRAPRFGPSFFRHEMFEADEDGKPLNPLLAQE